MSEFKQRWRAIPQWAKIVIYVILGSIGAVVMGVIFGYGVKALWNGLMPNLFGLKEISYWQAVGLLVLGRILFGSFGGSQSGEPKSSRCTNGNGDKGWKHYDEWWEREGKKDFDNYVSSMENGNGD